MMTLTAPIVSDIMSDMRIKKVAAPDRLVDGTRDVRLTFRLSARDKKVLDRMAEQAGVGASTMARLIVERYVKDHGGKR